MKFFIDTQQKIARNYYYNLGERSKHLKIEPVKYLKTPLEAVNLAHELYRLSTKTTWGYVRSFIPFTSVYSRRVAYHNCFVNACGKLKQLEENIKRAEKLQQQNVPRRTSTKIEFYALRMFT